uniref:Chromophore lyase CpcS/CpeS n=1 Tax=Lympha mucosa TaxID=2045360 RepID=A0A6B9VPH5_9FLOR|nr:Chromophore lyase [Lympha mucosa]
MNISNFFTLNKGKWVVQRTLYNIENKDIYNHNYDIKINFPLDSYAFREKKKLDRVLELTLFINNTLNQDISSLMIEKMNEKHNRGNIKKFLKMNNITYNFILHSNSVNYISLINQIGQLTIFEKVWFVNSNLRLSISLIKKKNKYLLTSFTSEIKINS